MTVVNHDTGEIVDTEVAERRASYICTDLDYTAASFEKAMSRMREAIAERDDVTLGYRSPGDYLSDRFGGRLARLGVDLRREVVRELTEAGLSTRAIAPVVGASFKTVARDIAAPPVSGDTPESPEAESPSPQGVAPDDGDVESAPEASDPQAAPRSPVVGIDGKTYSRPTPVDHATKAGAAVAEFADLAYYRDLGDLEHCWRLADTLRSFDPVEQAARLETLRRAIDVDRSKRDGTYRPTLQPASVCPTCGQNVRN